MPQITKADISIPTLMNTLPDGTALGFLAKNLDENRIIANYQDSNLMLPASTQKILTALVAKLVLQEQFQFETSLLTTAKIQNNTLKGNLIIKFTGDPDFTSDQLYKLLSQLKQKGIHKISGDLILDTAVFIGHDRGLGWIWNDLTMCFNSPPSAANIDNNCFYVELDANQPIGQLAKINIPSKYPIQVFGRIPIVNKNEAAFCQLDVIVHDNNRYQLKGCLAPHNKSFGLSFAVQDPNAYIAEIIKRQLARLNIEFKGKILQPHNSQKGDILAQHFSKPLPELIKKMLKKSDNQIADSLFRTIAFHYYNRPATFQLGAKAVEQILSSKAGIKFKNTIMADGSGLSRHNLISAQTMLQALEYIIQNENSLHLLDSFPIAGVDGTLSGRGSMIKEPLVKNISAKTGALKGVYNLAGFMTNKYGQKVAFVQFINGYSTGSLDQKTKRAPLVQFENKLYNALYQEK
ncbi:D-alanyl-D-alanine carboxypeptidase/D-alanyl-D-alanine-endopeptidase (penicillin-binding protein 4) [Bisgaardia hudsonensis]|uniref:D-alanyl-D-alanine carboxypeptidase/D-alanyl-D-alanine-endopeptidase (Penicillin-binding protein 4) n=1 Tax=Bisgaardia hudsonensis TaxID=109472 RepID=A0A4V6NQ97_9PAST|nr:serine-type D-Ala-D-Ala carboxypeptidase [Bisgaardia hudsonensis]TCP14390.1 D-alanyl-D-alanine carboxypeptidase/D-alanyl-D-alanine-endopeptidase (penicillin-binding protein 4) [Bisgaardia hudsonensis]